MVGQTTGDYRSVAAGNWTTLANWQRFDGTVWATPTVGQGYPSQNIIPGRVDINTNITLDNTPPNPVGDLYINAGTLELSAYNFTVNGITNITSILSDNNATGQVVFYGQITVANTATWTSIASISVDLRIYANIINNSTNVILNRLRVYANVVLSGTGTMSVPESFEFESNFTVTNRTTVLIGYGLNYNNTAGATWINEGTLDYSHTVDLLMGTGGILTASFPGNTVIYSAGGDQDIKTPSSSYYNLSTSGSGTKTILNNLVIGGTLNIGASTILNSNGQDLAVAGNWINNGDFTEGTRTVTFNGANNQNITNPANEIFNNLVINNSGNSGNNSLILSNSVTCNGILTMTSGNINTGSNILILTPTTVGSLNYTSGRIIGKFRRGVSTPVGTNYLFPVGTLTYYRPANFNFSTISTIFITAEFIESSPGVAGLPYNDGSSLNNTFQEGYWHFSSSLAPSNTYTLTLTGNGFTSYVMDGNTRITGRNAASPNWQLFGAHVSFANPTGVRNGITNLNTTSFDYAFATSCATVANAGSDVAICKGASTTLAGSGGGTYSWSPAYGLSATNIANPVANPGVTTTYTLTVTGGCTNTDKVTVTVNPLPPAALGYAYQKSITINGAQVSGGVNLIDFPMLVSYH